MKSEKLCRGGVTKYSQILLTGKSRNIYQSISSVYLLQKANPFQNIHIGPRAGIEKGTKRVYLPLQYSGMYHGPISFSKKGSRRRRLGCIKKGVSRYQTSPWASLPSVLPLGIPFIAFERSPSIPSLACPSSVCQDSKPETITVKALPSYFSFFPSFLLC